MYMYVLIRTKLIFVLCHLACSTLPHLGKHDAIAIGRWILVGHGAFRLSILELCLCHLAADVAASAYLAYVV